MAPMTSDPILTSISVNVQLRGHGIEPGQRQIVENLRSRAFDMQRHFQLAENTALLLDQSFACEVPAAIDDTYEAHAFLSLRTQLFRVLVVDLHAAILDNRRSSTSIVKMLQQLSNKQVNLPALVAYYTDPTALTVEIQGVPAEELERYRQREIERSTAECAESINAQWSNVRKRERLLDTAAARRISWARHSTAHLTVGPNGVVALDDDPPHGEGNLTWDEPIKFLRTVRELVYDVYALVTATSWDESGVAIDTFYAQAFWDRFTNGRTELKPPKGIFS